MKKSNRLFALLLALAMVITYMPAMAFATGEEGAGDPGKDAPAAAGEPAPDTEPDANGETDKSGEPGSLAKGAADDEAAQTCNFKISNQSGDVIKVKGVLNGIGYQDELASGGTKEYKNMDSLTEIIGASAIKFVGVDVPCTVSTYDDAEFKYGLAFDDELTVSAGITVKPDPNYSVITFNSNGGNGSMLPQTGRTGQQITLAKNTFTKEGCSFVGWRTKSGATFADEGKLTLNADGDLYAVWHEHDWTVEYVSGSDNEVTIACREADCPIGGVDLVMTAAPKTYDGSQYDGITVTDSDNLPEGFELTAISIFKDGELLDEPPTDAGTDYEARTELLFNGTKMAELSVLFDIDKRALEVKADDQTKAYSAPDPELTYTVMGLADGDTESKVLSGKLAREPGEDSGGYYIKQGTLKANDNYEMTFTNGILTIGNGISRVTKTPAAVEGLVFSGSKQVLIEAGEAQGGTLYYYKSEDDSTPTGEETGWKADAAEITGTSAKEFNVWYKVVGDSNHTSIPPQKIEDVKIAPKEVDVEWSKEKLIYDGNEQKPEAKAVDPETKTEIPGAVVTVGEGKVDAGPYTVSATGIKSSNYVLSDSASRPHIYMIHPRKAELSWTPNPQTFEYDGTAKEPAGIQISGLLPGDEPFGVEEYTILKFDPDDPDDDGTIVDEAVEPGSYKAFPSLENDNYSAIDYSVNPADIQMCSFEITKASINPAVSIAGWKYGEAPNDPKLAEGSNPGGGAVTYKYRVNGSWQDDPPQNAEKNVRLRVIIAETEHYQGGTAYCDFDVDKAPLELAVTIDGWGYKDDPNEPTLTGNKGKAEVEWKYYKKAAKEGDPDQPIDPESAGFIWRPGSYIVEANVAESDNYEAGNASAEFNVWKAVPDVTAPEAISGLSYNGGLQDLVTAGSVGSNLTMEYCISDKVPGEDASWSEEIPQGEDAGPYSVWYRVIGNSLYEDVGAMGPVNVTIKKAVPQYTKMPAAAEGLVYDGEKHELVTDGESSDGHFEFSMLPVGYSEKIPERTDAGKYSVYVKLVGNDNYGDRYFDPIPAEIKQAVLDTTIKINNWREGEDPSEPELRYNPENAGVTYKYKERSASEDTLTDEVPVKAGEYHVYAFIEETKNYKARTIKRVFTISEVPDAPVANEGLVYSGEDLVLIQAGDPKDSGVMKYSLDGEEYTDDIDEITGKDAGRYTVWYFIEGADRYADSTPQSLVVNIDQADAVITKEPEARNLKYTGEPQQLVTAGLVQGSTMKYNLDGGRYRIYIPKATEPGEYTVGYQAVGDSNHKDVYKWLTVTIGKADLTPVVSIEDWTYGEDPSEPSTVCYFRGHEDDDPVDIDEENISYEYKAEGASTYSKDVPTAVGTHHVRSVVKGSDRFNKAVSEDAEFHIKRADIKPKVYIIGWREGSYDASINAPIVFGNKGDAEVSYLYKKADSQEEYADVVPSEEGTYLVKAVVAESSNYNSGESEPYRFRIYEKATGVKTDPAAIEGLIYEPGDDGSGEPQELVIPGESTTSKGYFEYCVKTGTGKPGILAKWSKKTPTGTDAGTYYVWYRFVDKSHLIPDRDMCDEPLTVTIAQSKIEVGVNIKGWRYELYNPLTNAPKLTEGSNPGGGKVTYEYKRKDAGDDKYSKTVPILGKVGEYTVRATVAETDNFLGGSGTCDFEIKAAPATAVVVFSDDLTYNGKYQNLVKSAVCVGGDVMYEVYTVDEEGDEHLYKQESKQKPTAKDPGLYRVYYRIEADSNHYAGKTKSMDIEIYKKEIDPEVTIEGWTYGEEPNDPQLTEGSNPGGGAVTFKYYAYDEEGVPYEIGGVPSAAGSYMVEAVVADSDKYEGGSASCDFEISKADLKIKANDSSITYGEEAANKGVSAEGLVPGDEQILDDVTYKYGRKVLLILFDEYEPGDPAGDYRIVPGGIESDNYNVKYENGVMTVGPRNLSIVWPAVTEFDYDGKEHSVEPEFSGFYADDEDRFTPVTEGTSATDAGSYTAVIKRIKWDKSSLGDCYEYENEPVSCEWSIDPLALHVSVNDSSIVYGEEPKANGVTFDPAEFADGEDESVLGGELRYDFDGYKKYDDTGRYELTASGLESCNYDLYYKSGTLTVEPRPLTFTWGKIGFAYDGQEHSPEVTADSVNGDKLKVTLNEGAQKDAGKYNATVASVSDASAAEHKAQNYVIKDGEPTASHAWEIIKASLTVTANSKTITYGQEPSNAGVTYSGLAGGDKPADFDSQIRYSYSYKKNGKPGTYVIRAGGIVSPNYDVSYKDGSLKVDDVQSVLVAQGTAAGKTAVRLTWNEQSGAGKYVVYYAQCNTKKKTYKYKKAATLKAGKLTYKKNKLKKNTCYRFKVVAYRGGKKIGESETIHIATGNESGKYTNASAISVNKESVTVSKGSSVKIKASFKKAKKNKKLLNNNHSALARFTSTNTNVATVDGNGNIYGVGEGYCKVFVQSVNGLWKAVEVNVQ